jgi:hypothetical protein
MKIKGAPPKHMRKLKKKTEVRRASSEGQK